MADANALYKNAADVTLKAIDTHLQRPRLTPFGGLYTVVDIGTNADEFVPKALKATGVLVVPGGGFGESLTNGVRISFGPLVKRHRKDRRGLGTPRHLDAVELSDRKLCRRKLSAFSQRRTSCVNMNWIAIR